MDVISIGIIFDLDGVLLDSETNQTWIKRALKKTLEHFGIKPSNKNIMKIHSKNIFNFEKVSKEMNLDPEEFWTVRNKHYTYEKIYSMKKLEIKPFNDVKDIYDLKKKYGIYIISNSPQEVVDFFINGYGFSDLFKFGIGRGSSFADLSKIKPNIYMFDRLKKMVSHDEFVYIGDIENDRIFANNSNMDFIMVNRYGGKDGYPNLCDVVKSLLN